MRKLFLFLMLLPLISYAQRKYPYNTKDTLFINEYDFYTKGTQIKMGMGTLPTGDFKYIFTSPMSIAGATPIGKGYSGHMLTVKEYKIDGNKKRGYKAYLKAGGGNIVNYWVDIENALATGEIVSNVPQKQTTATASVADEIKKLKGLLDAGAITQAEYDAQKKKLLGQ